MAATVVGIRGATPIGSREPDAEVVEKLEELLQLARDGELRGFVIGQVYDQAITTGWSGKADKHLMLTAAALLSHRVAAAIEEAD